MSRGAYAKGIAKRREILEVALEVVAEKGFRGASNSEIARRVGLTQAGLMHYFGSREELYIAVLRARDERDGAAFGGDEPRFQDFLDVIAHNTQEPGIVQLYVEFSAEASIGEHAAHDFFVERYAWVRGLFAHMIRRAQAEGEFGPSIDPAAAADIMIATADGLQQQWLLDRSMDMVQRLKVVWAGLAALSWRSDADAT
ncbi:TetR/AcrR family transcriptional regulator [Microbacterium lacusdiani]